MKYVALLRGINVGGHNQIKMADLKKEFEKSGYTNVITFINSGNIIFESDNKSADVIESELEATLSQAFNYQATIIICSHAQMRKVVANVPSEWKAKNDLRCYIAFIKSHIPTETVVKEVVVKEGVDSLAVGEHVLYLSTKLSGLTKSGFTKLIGKKIFQSITIRNFTTSQKVVALMEF